MSPTLSAVKAILAQAQPNYPEAAKQLGTGALPFLERIVKNADRMTAAKAAYLAALVHSSKSVPVLKAAKSRKEPEVRLAAAAGARHFLGGHHPTSSKKGNPKLHRAMARVAIDLTGDPDPGVRRIAKKFLPEDGDTPKVQTVKALQALAKKDRNVQIRNSARSLLNCHGKSDRLK